MRKLIMLVLLAAGIAAVLALPAAATPSGTNGKIVVNVDNSVTGQEQVYTVDPDGTDLQFLANDAEAGQWSPDGTKIAIFGGYVNFDTGDYTDLGLPFASWTLDRLAAHLGEAEGIAMRRSRIGEILQREGLRWRQEETWFGARVDPQFEHNRGRSSASTPPRPRAA